MRFTAVTFFALLFAIGMAAQNKNFVYTDDNNTPNTVSAFQVQSNGHLTLLPDSPFSTAGNGGGSNVDPQEITTILARGRGFLYAANDGDGTISTFSIDRKSGNLTLIGSPLPAGSPNGNFSLAAGPQGNFLFSTDDVTPVIHVFRITNGTLTEIAGSPFPTASAAQGLKVTPNGQFLIVGLRDANSVAVYQLASTGTPTLVSTAAASGAATSVDANCQSNLVFNVNAGSTLIDVYQLSATGTLTPISGSPFSNGSSGGSFALAFNPNRNLLLAADGFTSEISSLNVASTGALQSAPGSPYSAANWTGSIATTRNGSFVYTALFVQGAVDGRAVAADGSLTPVPGTPFTTNQSQVGVLAVTTFPPSSCSAIDE
jgi:6-phosphogluconolactonase (cycloisomerase 2 family)